MCEQAKQGTGASQIRAHELDRLHLSRLAQAMTGSSWQLEQLCKIKMNPLFRLCRALFLYAEQFACCNLYPYVDIQKLARENEIDSSAEDASDQYGTIAPRRWLGALLAQNELKFGRLRRSRVGTLLARAYLAYYVLSVALLTRSIASQYKYDFYRYHLSRYQAANATDSQRQIVGAYERHRLDEAELASLQASARAESTRSGSFLLEQAFFAECCYILMIELSLLLYLVPVLYYRLAKGAYDFYFLRMVLDWDVEQANCNQMVQRVVETVAKSSAIFTRTSGDQLRALARDMLPGRRASTGPCTGGGGLAGQRPCRPTIDELQDELRQRRRRRGRQAITAHEPGQVASLERLYRLEHRWLERRLKLMALAGRLQPLDRCETGDIVGSLATQIMFICLICPGCYIWNICLFGSLPRIFNFAYDTSWASVGSMFWLGGMNVALTFAGVYYFSTCLVYCKSQVLIVRKLRRMIGEFLRLNRAINLARRRQRGRIACGEATTTTTTTTLGMMRAIMMSCDEHSRNDNGNLLSSNEYDLINSHLLLLVMQYKIFVAQQRHTKTNFSYLIVTALGLMFIMPILARLHAPYLRADLTSTLIIIVCLIMIGLPDMAVFPIAWSNARSSALYNDLASLHAHVIHWQGQLAPGEHGFYNEHTMWLLSRELRYPENFRHQFAIRAFNIEFSYKELLKIHFWLGLMIITFALDFQQATPGGVTGADGSGGDTSSLTRWITDPLGIKGSYN